MDPPIPGTIRPEWKFMDGMDSNFPEMCLEWTPSVPERKFSLGMDLAGKEWTLPSLNGL
jgi:hypothetical protein